MKPELEKEKETILNCLAQAVSQKPAYAQIYPFLKAVFLTQLAARDAIVLPPVDCTAELAGTKWEAGFPLLQRWEFPIDTRAAETILKEMEEHIPQWNTALGAAHAALRKALARQSDHPEAFWQSFLHHEWEPWEEWVDTKDVEIAPLIFWARACVQPSLEWVARDLLTRFPLPKSWLKGYCPSCGSLPGLLFLKGEGERFAHCSWCGSQWGLYRLQCPYCDNRTHESLGYMMVEEEADCRIQYCRICKTYFKLIDTRERLTPPYFPLEEWTSVHLDLLAQSAGWQQPPSPSPVVYGEGA